MKKQKKRPVIGITCHPDNGCNGDIFPGRALNYIDRIYSDVLVSNGAIPFIIPVNEDLSYIWSIIDSIDGLLCSGGGKIPQEVLDREEIPGLHETSPQRYSFEDKLFRLALKEELPILGMCRGLQMMNEILGGDLIMKIPSEGFLQHNQVALGIPLTQPYHEIHIEQDSLLYGLIRQSKVKVNSWHSQSVKKVGSGLRAVAFSEDGIIEAVEGTGISFLLLSQFHPELLCKEYEIWGNLFSEFVNSAIERSQQRRGIMK